MFEFLDIVNEIIQFMKRDMNIDGFVFSFWDIFVYMIIFGTACWIIGKTSPRTTIPSTGFRVAMII